MFDDNQLKQGIPANINPQYQPIECGEIRIGHNNPMPTIVAIYTVSINPNLYLQPNDEITSNNGTSYVVFTYDNTNGFLKVYKK